MNSVAREWIESGLEPFTTLYVEWIEEPRLDGVPAYRPLLLGFVQKTEEGWQACHFAGKEPAEIGVFEQQQPAMIALFKTLA